MRPHATSINAARSAPAPRSRSRHGLAVVGVGVATGTITLLAQGAVPGALNQIANIGAPWLIVAILMGRRSRTGREAIAAGVATLLLALVGYYVAAQIVQGAAGSTVMGTVVFWIAVSLIGGPTFGLAGHWIGGGSARLRPIGIALLAAALIGEGGYQVAVAWTPLVGYAELALGLAIPLVVARSAIERVTTIAWLAPAVIAGGAAFLAFSWLAGRL